MRGKIQVATFYHPDYTVGTGITPAPARLGHARGLYRRSGIAPCPKGYFYEVIFIIARNYIVVKKQGEEYTELTQKLTPFPAPLPYPRPASAHAYAAAPAFC